MSEYQILMGEHMYNIMDAVLKGDQKEIDRLQAIQDEKNRQDKEREYKFLEDNLPPNDFLAFVEIDKKYKRHIRFTSTVNFMGSSYSYCWFTDTVKVKYKNYGKFDLMIDFSKGKFRLGCYYSDETGYDQGGYYAEVDIDPSLILDKIKSLK